MTPIQNLFDLTDEVVVITGGAGLLGTMHAEAVIEANGTPVLLDIDETRLEAATTRLRQDHPESIVHGLPVDITLPSAVQQALAATLDRCGRVDALINNAAVNPAVTQDNQLTVSSRFETISLAQWNLEINVGLTGAFLCTQVFGTWMAQRRKGAIINIASDLAIIGPDQRLYYQDGVAEEDQIVKPVTYSVIKTGLLGLTRYLATYWADKHVRVNTLSLGGVFNDQSPTFLERVYARIPLGRLANRDEYKGCIVFLCSSASSYMTGANLVVDGGRTIW